MATHETVGSTMDQAKTTAVLDLLKLEQIPPPEGIYGASSEYKITDATIKHMESLLGSKVCVGHDGVPSIE